MKNRTKALILIILGIAALYTLAIRQDNKYIAYAKNNNCKWYTLNGQDVCK